MDDDPREAWHDRRVAEIGYAVVTGAVLVGGPALVGHLLGWSAAPGYAPVIVLLAVLAVVRGGRLLLPLEAHLREEQRGAGSDAPSEARSGARPEESHRQPG